jgi:hypothetical protein
MTSDPGVLGMLSGAYAILARLPVIRWRLPTGPLKRAARGWLRRVVLRDQLHRQDDVTILIGVRDRADYRLANALASLRAQSHPQHLVRIVVVDYGSEIPTGRRIEDVCRRYRADYMRVDHTSAWNRSRCLNVAIRRTTTKYVLTSDVDLLFSPTYVADAIQLLRRLPLTVVCSAMLDLPAECVERLEALAREGGALRLDQLVAGAAPRSDLALHPSIGVTYTVFYQLIRGYDEFYELYGSEDEDLAKRFRYLGLDLVALDTPGFYLHQWHPKFEGVEVHPSLARVLVRNHDHLTHTHTILRNPDGWGTLPGGGA